MECTIPMIPKPLNPLLTCMDLIVNFQTQQNFTNFLPYNIISHKTTSISNNFSRNSLCYFGDLPQVQFPTSSWCKQVSHFMFYPFGRCVLLAKNFDLGWDYQWSTLLHHQWLVWFTSYLKPWVSLLVTKE